MKRFIPQRFERSLRRLLCLGLLPIAGLMPLATQAADQRPEAGGEDLWRQFCEQTRFPRHENAAVTREARKLSRSRSHFFDLLVRAEEWMWHLMQAVAARGLPMDLAALPAVESAFAPRAQSPRAAGGLWQMLPSTARQLGLRIDATYDGRADVGEATRAALDYLEYLHDRFGDWSLALAAYNAGEARIARAIEATGQASAAVGRSDLRLPAETRTHYTRLLAFIRVTCAPERHGVRRPRLPARALNIALHFNRRVSLQEIAQIARTPVAELRALNPALSGLHTPDGGPHRVRVPAHRVRYVERNLPAVPDLALARYGQHRIAPGETLSQIARQYETSIRTLKQINALTDSTIRSGSTLRVPLGAVEG